MPLKNTVLHANSNLMLALSRRLKYLVYCRRGGWSGGAKMLGKLSVTGRPTSLNDSRARAYCACSRCGWGCLDVFSLIYLFSFLSPSLWETARYRLKYCLKGPLNPKQPTNQLLQERHLVNENLSNSLRFILYTCVLRTLKSVS